MTSGPTFMYIFSFSWSFTRFENRDFMDYFVIKFVFISPQISVACHSHALLKRKIYDTFNAIHESSWSSSSASLSFRNSLNYTFFKASCRIMCPNYLAIRVCATARIRSFTFVHSVISPRNSQHQPPAVHCEGVNALYVRIFEGPELRCTQNMVNTKFLIKRSLVSLLI